MARRTNDDDETETPAAPDPWAILERLTAALEANKQQPSTEHTESINARLTEALERLAESNIQGAQIMASETRRAHRPSNEVVPGISVFNRRGEMLPDYQKPKLKCIMMLPWLVEWESCTREEVELLNLLQAGEYNLKRIDNSKVRCTVVIDFKVDGITPSRLVMNHDTAFNNDNFKLMPPMTEMLRQILRQSVDKDIMKAAAAVLTDDEEEALIEAGELSISV